MPRKLASETTTEVTCAAAVRTFTAAAAVLALEEEEEEEEEEAAIIVSEVRSNTATICGKRAWQASGHAAPFQGPRLITNTLN